MSGFWKILGWFLMLGLLHQVNAVSIPKSYWVYDLSGQRFNRIEKTSKEDVLKVNISGKLALCHHFDRGYIKLDVSGGLPPYTFRWSNGDTSSSRTDLYSGTYTVTIKDSQGMEHQERIVVQPPFPLIAEIEALHHASCSGQADGLAKLNIRFGRGEPYKIIWSHGLEDELEAVGLSPGNYTVRVIDNYNCDATLSFEIKSNAATIEIQEDIKQISCLDGSLGSISLDVSGGQEPYSFIWSHGEATKDLDGLKEGKYEVMIKDQAGCVLTKTYEISSPQAIEVDVLRVKHNQCFGAEDGEIDIQVKGGQAPYTYSWSNGSKSQNLRGLKEGRYILTVKDANGCISENAIEINQPRAFKVEIETSIDLDCESGDAVGFAWVNIEGGNAPYTIQWGTGEKDVREIGFSGSGEITVEILDQMGCIISEKIRVVFPLDNMLSNRLDFHLRKVAISSEKEVHVAESLVFESEIAEDFIAWEWDFGDGAISVDKNPVHIYKASGEFNVTLRAYDIYGCSSLQSRTVKVLEQDEWVTIPNAFTPNGDGLNDVFQPVMKGIVQFEMDIFNQWGEHLYTSQGIELSGWDGTYKGQLLPRGNYVYKIQYTTISGENVTKTGTVSMVL